MNWMQNVNVRLGIAVAIAAMPVIIGDLSADKFGWLTIIVMIANMLSTAKAFMSDPTLHKELSDMVTTTEINTKE